MDERKAAILNAVIREHIETGVPVGSGVLVEKYDLGVSPATVRNVMAALEADGFITQPHTSAGRVPTERGYRRYLVTLNEKPLALSEREKLAKMLKERGETAYKTVARHLADECGTAVFWAFHRRNLYYTGVTNLLKQPEFAHLEKVYDISTVIDRIDEIVDRIFESSNEGVQVLIGSENPFGHFCGSVIIRYRAGDHAGMVGLIGPMRMDYEGNLALVKELRNLLS